MKLYHKLSTLFMSGLILVSGSILTGCDNDDLDTNPYNKGGVNLLSFGPCPLNRLDNMRITGTQLNKVDKILFPQGNSLIEESTTYVEAEFQLINKEEIQVVVPNQTVPGKLRLVAGNDTIVSVSNITFTEETVVENVTPTKNLRAGDVITITGEYVWNIASITFNKLVVVEAENFLKNTRNEVQVAIPLEAQSGEIVISNGADNEITWIEPLEIRKATVTSMSAQNVEFGETIVITGADLDLVEKVRFPLVSEGAAFTVNAAGTELTTTIPMNTVSGIISLNQYSGLIAESPAYVLPMAGYISISPQEELEEGDVVDIVGTNLNRITSLELPGNITLKQGDFTQSETSIQFTVPKDMGDGKVVLVQHENYRIETDKIAMRHDGAETVIWSGSWECASWAGNQELAWGGFDWSKVKVGQEIIFYVEFIDPTAGWACISPRVADGWGNLSSVGQIDLTPGTERQRVSFKPTAEDLAALQSKNGLVITGDGFILKQVALSILEEVVWSGNWECASWAGNQELAWGGYDWSTFQLGQKIIFTVGFINPTGGWACISPRLGDGWGNMPSVGQIDLTPSAEDQKVVFIPTAADIEALQTKNGLVITGDGFILKRVSIQ